MKPHSEDYTDAHRRHWEDAELLFERERWANADHLYGFSAECGLKAVLDAEGQSIEGGFRKHVQDLWPTFISFAQGLPDARHLRAIPAGEPFRNWSHHDRYAHRCYANRNVAEPHRVAARDIRAMVQAWILDGQP